MQKKGSTELDYNELNTLPLMDAVCREFLRLYPPVTFVWREYVSMKSFLMILLSYTFLLLILDLYCTIIESYRIASSPPTSLF